VIGRRRFIGGSAALAGAAGLAVAGVRASDEPAVAVGSGTTATSVPVFHGKHQAGIVDARQARAAVVAFDLTAANRTELTDVLRALAERARWLTTGGTPPNLGISAPPADSGILGPTVAPGNLTVTVSLGASAFDDRFGLAGRKPARLRAMDTFGNDNLDRAQCDGDVLIQIGADESDTVIHALRDLARHTRGGLQVRWRVDGFVAQPRPSGAARNLLGFKDGTANPDPKDFDSLVWVGAGPDEPSWTAGGTYHVVRVIRMLVEFWDRVTIGEQEAMIGRRRDTGAPFSGSAETDLPDYTHDPNGATIPLDAHIRLANPRTVESDPSRILRRAYNYDRGVDSNGNLDMGLIFSCFQQDLDRQFVAVQQRLADEPLVDYISPVGGGYFFALPGVTDSNDWYGRQLLS
jgi:deferrochelatase/peroxidase EfeB